jgi:hypothetical protein
MQDNINAFHKEAFATPQGFEADVENSYDEAPYEKGLQTQGMVAAKYTSGDTRYQAEQPLIQSHLTTLPSKVSKRYSPQNDEQNTGMPLPPEPTFMKDSGRPERITSVRGLINRENIPVSEKRKSSPLAGVDFARTHSEAAALLERLGKKVSFEAHHSALVQEASQKSLQTSVNNDIERITVDLRKAKAEIADLGSKIVLSSVPEKNYDNLNLVAVGQEAFALDSQLRTAKSAKTFVATRNVRPSDAISANELFAQEQAEYEEILSQSTEASNRAQALATQRSANLVTLIEDKLAKAKEESDEILDAEDATKVIRRVMDDYVQMRSNNSKEQHVQMRNVETKVKKIMQAELPEEIESKVDAVNEIKEIIHEVVKSHPNLVQRNSGSNDMEFSLAARDTYLRVQIEQELREKFELRLVENNKLMEKKNLVVFEEMIDRFLNP